MLGRAYNYSVLTASPSVLSAYEGGKEALVKTLMSKPSMAIILLRSLLRDTVEIYNKINIVNTTAISINRYIASLGLSFFRLFPETLQKAEMKTDDPVLSFSYDILKFQSGKGNHIPESITMDFLKGDYLDPERQRVHLNIQFDRDELDYLRRFSNLDPSILGAIFTKDPQLILVTAQKIGNAFFDLLNGLIESIDHLENIVSLLCTGPHNLIKKGTHVVSRFSEKRDPKNRENYRNFLQFLMNLMDVASKQYESLWSVSLWKNADQSNINQIRQFLQMNPSISTQREQASSSQIKVDPSISEESKNIAQKVFHYSGSPPAKFQDYTRLMNELKQFKDPLDTESRVRKTRNSINALYWEVYEAAMLKHFKRRSAPKTFGDVLQLRHPGRNSPNPRSNCAPIFLER